MAEQKYVRFERQGPYEIPVGEYPPRVGAVLAGLPGWLSDTIGMERVKAVDSNAFRDFMLDRALRATREGVMFGGIGQRELDDPNVDVNKESLRDLIGHQDFLYNKPFLKWQRTFFGQQAKDHEESQKALKDAYASIKSNMPKGEARVGVSEPAAYQFNVNPSARRAGLSGWLSKAIGEGRA